MRDTEVILNFLVATLKKNTQHKQTKLSLVFLIYSTHLKYWQFNRN